MVRSNELARKSVLDKGFVAVEDYFGSDLTVVNAARVSYADRITDIGGKDVRFIHDLAKNRHFSTFRHCGITFRIKAPLMVARQWWRYSVSSAHREEQFGWNEVSRRYTDGDYEFYYPENLDDIQKEDLEKAYSHGLRWYNRLRGSGLKPEVARLALPAYGIYTEWLWTTSLQGLTHFLKERLDGGAQEEIYQYAGTVYELSMGLFPHSISALVGFRGEEFLF